MPQAIQRTAMPLSIAQLLAIFDQEQRQDVRFFDVLREVAPGVIRLVPREGLEGGGGAVIYSCLTAENADEVIEEQIAYFEAIGCEFGWKAYDHDTPADLQTRLLSHGFAPGEPEAVVVLDLEEAPEFVWQPVAHDVRRIEQPDGIEAVTAVQTQVWDEEELPPWVAEHLRQEIIQSGDQLAVYVAYVDGSPASAAWVRFHTPGRFASLWGGSTVPEHRRRGLYRALVAIRAQEARRRGFRFLTVDASPMSRPILETLGFRCISYANEFRWPAGRSPIELQGV
jgi:GNAT superfamily N-acetyltransferase